MKNKSNPAGHIRFPDPRILPDDAEGLIYVGGNLEIETLVRAYRLGIYPWPLEPNYPLFWFCPEPRGILQFSDLHIPHSLEKVLRKHSYQITFNQNFQDVIDQCAIQKRQGQSGTWIIPEMVAAYKKFFAAGYAHSVEVWDGEKLVGGLYGVFVDGVFSGESMFHLLPNTSKIALVALVEKLKEKGLSWIDIQMTTPVTQQLGGKYISRTEFLNRLDQVHSLHPSHKLKF